MQNKSVVFWELASHEMGRSARFLRGVFGWQSRRMAVSSLKRPLRYRLALAIACSTNPPA